ncbi:intradiol ring-cleavage dioxygenase [Actinomadura decatromicini]|uniref:intradiol ring-cleavage dioxygenase n=1 Tax=Actinomadura decatromicini TaxID=2604572 RepID=UPI001CA30821|nr:intradiol ring-cleavage dioxygenase [Actinomadura decatromicini]
MHEDEKAVERTGLSRRAALTAMGGVGLTVGAAAGGVVLAGGADSGTAKPASGTKQPSCVLSPESIEGPYYLDYEMVRRNVTEDRPGVPLILRTTVVDSRTCRPIPKAAVDIWHCDAGGVYSGYDGNTLPGGGTPPTGAPTGPPPGGGGGMHQEPVNDLTFLRGVQLANGNGDAEFATVYPGWYQGRALHIHVKVHIGGKVDPQKKTYTGGHVSHTGQLYFAEDLAEKIAKLSPYKDNTLERVKLEDDFIYQQANSGLLTIRPLHKGRIERGLLATVTLGVDPTATPSTN